MDEQLSSLAQDLAEVGRLRDDDDVTAVLRRLVERASRTIPGCDHAMVTVSLADNRLETVAGDETASLVHEPSDPRPWAGPIREAMLYREPRRVDDVDTETRWPGFRDRMTLAQFRSCLALPVPTQRHPRVVFSLFSKEPQQFGDHVLDLVLLFALQGGATVDNVALYSEARQLVEHLHEALATREAIGRAKGILMHRFSWGDDEALGVLRRLSQRNNIKVRDLSAEISRAQLSGDLDDTLKRWFADGAEVSSPGPETRADGERP